MDNHADKYSVPGKRNNVNKMLCLSDRIKRKLLTKPFWLWQRHRPYPIRNRIFSFPALATDAAASAKIVVLTTPQNLNNAAWTAYSLLRGLPITVGLEFVIDGETGGKQREMLLRTFQGCTISSTMSCVAQLASSAPSIQRLSEYHPMGRKLATVLALQQRSNILFTDDDILCFGRMNEIFEAVSAGTSRGLYLQESCGRLQVEPTIMEAVKTLGLPMLSTINVGLLFIRKESLSIATAEAILNQAGDVKSWFPDTVILSVLMALAGAQPLCSENYVVSTEGQFYFERKRHYDALILRHFTTPVRHLMYSEGMPFLFRTWFSDKRQHPSEI